MTIPVKTKQGEYNIYLGRGMLGKAAELFMLERKVLIVTDSGVPKKYSEKLSSLCKESYVYTLRQGEKSKNLKNFENILKKLVEYGFTRTDCVVAVGGGVVGDLAGFAASAYMRGIDFYNVPTTVLSQVDSSIGGKTAVDFMGLKNIVGAFYQPKGVIIDPDTLKTLSKRQRSNGLAEALKTAMIADAELFDIFAECKNMREIEKNVDEIIYRSILVKKNVVEQDEKESGLRKTLNFGHTLAHGIESVNRLRKLYHGECVAIGMVPMCSEEARERLLPILKKLNLQSKIDFDVDEVIDACKHDKKTDGESITVVFVDRIGCSRLEKMSFEDYKKMIKRVYTK